MSTFIGVQSFIGRSLTLLNVFILFLLHCRESHGSEKIPRPRFTPPSTMALLKRGRGTRCSRSSENTRNQLRPLLDSVNCRHDARACWCSDTTRGHVSDHFVHSPLAKFTGTDPPRLTPKALANSSADNAEGVANFSPGLERNATTLGHET